MDYPIINSREDLDALAGTEVHDAFMASLAGTLWRLERDDVAHTWRVVECNLGIERFGFTREDFPDVVAPVLPAYTVPAKTKAERIKDELWKVGATEEWQVEGAAAGALALGMALGKTKEQLYVENAGFHKAQDVMDAIAAIRAEP